MNLSSWFFDIKIFFVCSFVLGLCTKTDSKDFSDNCCIEHFPLYTKVIPVYSFLCAGTLSLHVRFDD